MRLALRVLELLAYPPGIPTLTEMTIGNGYWIKINAGGTLTSINFR